MDHTATQLGGAYTQSYAKSVYQTRGQTAWSEGGGRLSGQKEQAHSSSSEGVEQANKTAAWDGGVG